MRNLKYIIFVLFCFLFCAAESNLDNPFKISVDKDGRYYIANTQKHQIEVYDQEEKLILTYGEKGNSPGKFYYPQAVICDLYDNVYVLDTGNHHLQKFKIKGSSLEFVKIVDISGIELDYPRDMDLSPDGTVIYILDSGNSRVLMISADSDNTLLGKFGSLGAEDAQFINPYGLSVDYNGNIYIADTNNSRIQKYDKKGNYIRTYGKAGIGKGQFLFPQDVYVGMSGIIYIADSGNNKIQKIDQDGKYLETIDLKKIKTPHGLAYNMFNNKLYVSGINNEIETSFIGIGVKVNQLSIEPTKFSPNNDGVKDTITFRFNLTQKVDVQGEILKSNKVDLVATCFAEKNVKDNQMFVWTSTEKIEDGEYYYRIVIKDPQNKYEATYVYGKIEVDITPPEINDLAIAPVYFSPNGDGLFDTTKISFRINEPGAVYCELNNTKNILSKILSLPQITSLNSELNLVWDGKNFQNQIKNGEYIANIYAVDTVGNSSKIITASIYVNNNIDVITDLFFDPDVLSRDSIATLNYQVNEKLSTLIKIFDGKAELVRVLKDYGEEVPGGKVLSWDGKNNLGEYVADGVYNCKLLVMQDSFTIKKEFIRTIKVDNKKPEIVNVSLSAEKFSPLEGEKITLKYTLVEDSKVSINILDKYFQYKNNVFQNSAQKQGEYSFEWNGVLEKEKVISDNVYYFQISAKDDSGLTAEKTIKFEVVGNKPYFSNVIVNPETFSPNGDSKDDLTVVNFSLGGGHSSSLVNALIEDSSGKVIKKLIDNKETKKGNYSLDWYGTNDEFGNPIVEDGLYYLKLSAKDTEGNEAEEIEKEVYVAANVPILNNLKLDASVYYKGSGTYLNISSLLEQTNSIIQNSKLENYLMVYIRLKDSNNELLDEYVVKAEPGNFNYQWQDDKLAVGNYSFKIYAVDILKNKSIEHILDFSIESNIASLALPVANPNPFTPNGDGNDDVTSIIISMPEPGTAVINIYNSSGAIIKTIEENLVSGNQAVIWDGTDNSGVKQNFKAYYKVIVSITGNSGKKYQTVPGLLKILGSNVKVLNGRADKAAFSPLLSSGANFTYDLEFTSEDPNMPDQFSGISLMSIPGGIGYVSVNVFDSSGNIVVNLENNLEKTVGTYSVLWDGKISGTPVPEGEYTLRAVVKDYNNQVSSIYAASTVFIDITKPQLITSLVSPNPFSPVSQKINYIQAEINDNSLTTINWEIKIKDSSENLIKSIYGVGNNIIQQWDGKDNAGGYVYDGLYSCYLRVYDYAGNILENKIADITIDTSAPLLEKLFVSPAKVLSWAYDDQEINTNNISLVYSSKYGVTMNLSVSGSITEDIYASLYLYKDDSMNNLISTIFEHNQITTSNIKLKVPFWDGKDSLGNSYEDGIYYLVAKIKDSANNESVLGVTVNIFNEYPILYQHGSSIGAYWGWQKNDRINSGKIIIDKSNPQNILLNFGVGLWEMHGSWDDYQVDYIISTININDYVKTNSSWSGFDPGWNNIRFMAEYGIVKDLIHFEYKDGKIYYLKLPNAKNGSYDYHGIIDSNGNKFHSGVGDKYGYDYGEKAVADIVLGESNDIYCVWADRRIQSGGDTFYPQIYFKKSSNYGVTYGTEKNISTWSPINQDRPQSIFLLKKNNNLAVFYERYSNTHGRLINYVIKSTDYGDSWTTNELTFTTDKLIIKTIIDKDKNWFVIFDNNTYIKSSDSGNTWSAPKNVPANYSDIVFENNKIFVVIEETDSENKHQVFLQASFNDGDTWTKKIMLSGVGKKYLYGHNNPMVNVYNNQLYIAWKDSWTNKTNSVDNYVFPTLRIIGYFEKIDIDKYLPIISDPAYSGGGVTLMSLAGGKVHASTELTQGYRPVLMSPAEGDIVNTDQPAFTWLSPTWSVNTSTNYKLEISNNDEIFTDSDDLSIDLTPGDITITGVSNNNISYTLKTSEKLEQGGIWFWRVAAEVASGNFVYSADTNLFSMGDVFELDKVQNYPNPFKATTRIRYRLTVPATVTLRIYNEIGRLVKVFDNVAAQAGYNEILWDGQNGLGEEVVNGVYIYELIAVNQSGKKLKERGKIARLR